MEIIEIMKNSINKFYYKFLIMILKWDKNFKEPLGTLTTNSTIRSQRFAGTGYTSQRCSGYRSPRAN
jgi:hypothetical protein